MTGTLLQTEPKLYLAKIRKRKALCIAVAVFCVALNVLFVLLSSGGDKPLWVIGNILSTVACGWFLVAYVSLAVAPMSNLYSLATLPTEKLTVEILQIENDCQRISHFDCVKVHTQNRILFLIVDTFTLCQGQTYTFDVASNIITGVSQ